jgi:transcriptional regulator with XRE-family HTH domain
MARRGPASRSTRHAVPLSQAGSPQQIGGEVRTRRTAAGLSIAEVARRAEVSAPFISQLEAGRTSISIPTLYRVAAALGCTPNALLGTDDGDEPLLLHAGDGRRLPVSAGEHAQHARLLSRPGERMVLEACHYLITPGDDEQDWFVHAGEDFVYVLRGTIKIEFAGGRAPTLGAGDSMHHDGTVPHRWMLVGDDPAEALIVTAIPPGERHG